MRVIRIFFNECKISALTGDNTVIYCMNIDTGLQGFDFTY